jgi:hypothetical protein
LPESINITLFAAEGNLQVVNVQIASSKYDAIRLVVRKPYTKAMVPSLPLCWKPYSSCLRSQMHTRVALRAT